MTCRFINYMQIALRQVIKKDLKIIRDWRNVDEIKHFSGQFTLLNMKDQEKWFAEINKTNSKRIMFMIMYKKIPIGVCGLIHYDAKNKCADVAIIIGETKMQGKRFGTKSLQILIDYGFKKLRLHRIGAEIFEYNTRSLRLFKSLNFKHEATLREVLWRDGRWWNVHIYSLMGT